VEEAQEHLKAELEKKGLTAECVVNELALLGFANMADYLRLAPGGEAYVDLSKLTREQAAALTEVSVEDFTDGRGKDARAVRRVKIKLADKRAALVDLGKHLGVFREADSLACPLTEAATSLLLEMREALRAKLAKERALPMGAAS